MKHDGGAHVQTLFDQADQPVQVTRVVAPEGAELSRRLPMSDTISERSVRESYAVRAEIRPRLKAFRARCFRGLRGDLAETV
jgi:hypothetical protein